MTLPAQPSPAHVAVCEHGEGSKEGHPGRSLPWRKGYWGVLQGRRMLEMLQRRRMLRVLQGREGC